MDLTFTAPIQYNMYPLLHLTCSAHFGICLNSFCDVFSWIGLWEPCTLLSNLSQPSKFPGRPGAPAAHQLPGREPEAEGDLTAGAIVA